MIFNKVLSILISYLCVVILAVSAKCIYIKPESNIFYRLKTCQRSNQSVVGLGNFEHIEDCANLTRKLRGLAFNFSLNRDQAPFKESTSNSTLLQWKIKGLPILDQPEEFYNCIALKCPEFSNFSTMVSDNRFDYYSLYANPPPPPTATCLPELGMFHIYTRPMNYSTAFVTCQTESQGTLAHVVSEARTFAISEVLEIVQSKHRGHSKLAYVGLNFSLNVGGGTIFTSEGESLECFSYKAWAPGYPRRGRNDRCVAITTEASWIDVDCQQKLPFVCEIYTSGPRHLDFNKNSNIC